MARFTISEILQATSGTLLQTGRTDQVRGVGTNSAKVKKGELFIALVGKKHDAHQFIPQAIKQGISAIVVSRDLGVWPQGIAVIKVKDTTCALGDIARFHRRRFKIPVIAITGSAGKTTTKEMIALVLQRKYRVLKNMGTENNQFGVPLTILKLKPTHDLAVLEVGTNSPGDIQWLASIVQPTVAVMTNIGESHLELLKSTRHVFKEKMALVKALALRGVAIVNGDDPFLRTVPDLTEHRVYKVGIDQPSDMKADQISLVGHGLQFQVKGQGRYQIRGTARANVYNALSAICCGRLFKIGYNDIKQSLAKFAFKSGRQAMVKAGGIIVIDDTYNANPVSFRSALQSLSSLESGGRKVLVCADMLELGRHSERLHREVGVLAAKSGLNFIVSYGQHARCIGVEASRRNPQLSVVHATTPQEVEEQLKNYLQPKDVVLIKGSRGMRSEQFVTFIQSYFKRER